MATKATPTVKLSTTRYTYDGTAKRPSVTVTVGGTKLTTASYRVTYANNIRVGTASATVTLKGAYSGSKKVSFRIAPKRVTPTVSLSKSSFPYDGRAKRPTVTVKAGTKQLTSTNYTVRYSNNTNAGTASVTVTLKGNYSGSKKTSFKILAKKVAPKVTLAKATLPYDGTVKHPSVSVMTGTKRISSTSYDVTYSAGCKSIGTYKAKVKLKGNYAGTKEVAFSIVPRDVSLAKLEALPAGFEASWKEQSTHLDGYQLQFCTSKSFKSGYRSAKVARGTTSKKVTSLKGNTTYYVRIRAYDKVGTKFYYSEWSTPKEVKTLAQA